MKNMNRERKAFSLIELLCVVAAVSVLATMVSMSLTNMGSSRLKSGGNLLVDLAYQARQNSMAGEEMTALVMAQNTGDPELDNRAFILLERGAGDAVWTPLTRWTILPEGIAADSVKSVRFTDADQMPDLTPKPGPLPNFRGKTVQPADCAYQVFLPRGGLSIFNISEPRNPSLHLVETGKEAANPGYANYYEVTLDRLTGVPRVKRP